MTNGSGPQPLGPVDHRLSRSGPSRAAPPPPGFRRALGRWALDICHSLVIGHWSFPRLAFPSKQREEAAPKE